jgi:hypothetical protein
VHTCGVGGCGYQNAFPQAVGRHKWQVHGISGKQRQNGNGHVPKPREPETVKPEVTPPHQLGTEAKGLLQMGADAILGVAALHAAALLENRMLRRERDELMAERDRFKGRAEQAERHLREIAERAGRVAVRSA